MIQDIHGIYHNEYQNLTPEQDDYIMFAQGRSVLMSRDGEQTIQYITYGELIAASGGDLSADACRYLFSIENQGMTEKYFLSNSQLLTSQLMEKYEYRQQNVFRTMKPEDKAFAGITACQLANWYESTQFCGRCGMPVDNEIFETGRNGDAGSNF